MGGREISLLSFGLIGGLAIFIYGMHLAAEGLQKIAGGRLKAILGLLTKNRFLGMIIGLLATVATQSSSATTVMLVSFANAGLMELRQTIAVILGADIGTTLTVQLIAFKISDYAPLGIALGFIMTLLKERRRIRYVGQVILGFSFVFFGMGVMSTACHPLRTLPGFTQALLSLEKTPLLGILTAAAFTAVIQSSAATLGLTLVLAGQGLLTMRGAIPIILGANIGTCATALLASMGTSREGKQVALAHLLFKVVGVLIFLPLLSPFGKFVEGTSENIGRQIANAHTMFNVINTLLFLPFVLIMANFIKRLIPARPAGELIDKSKYLDEKVLDMPALALSQATKEVLRIADISLEMVRESLMVLLENDERTLQKLRGREKMVDSLSQETIGYLTRLSQRRLSDEESRRGISLLYIANDLEHIGDLVNNNLLELAQKKMDKDLSFSIEGALELERMHRKVLDNLEMAVNALAQSDLSLARKAISSKAEINQMERDLRRAHLSRLGKELPETTETSTIHLDVIDNLKRINSHAANIGYAILGEL
ncbi:Na/Pi cotransporter family protein [bacterium]|nr:Na/Pi cotransporter family protein [bacterium]MCK4326143.1 Na/Pi cotransporter family protein [bacterium]MCK4437233.1 Na/Pi cotransporter family protein [bacterium]